MDWGTDSANDDGTEPSDDEIPEPAEQVRRRSTSYRNTDRGYQSEPDPNDSVAYDHYEPTRQVSSLELESASNNSEQRLLWLAMSSLESKLEIIESHAAQCSKCKNNKGETSCDLLGDSGASLTFTHSESDFTEYERIENGPSVQTADAKSALKIAGKGAVFLTHQVKWRKQHIDQITRLYPVYHIPGLHIRLLSLGALLADGLLLRGDKTKLAFTTSSSPKEIMTLHPHMPGQTLFWLSARITPAATLLTMSGVSAPDYDTMHRRFGHPSKDVLRHASGNTKNFPSGISFPKNDPICRGCAEGKMPSQSFPPSVSRATKPFELVHTDLKALPTISYHKYKYFITFLDDFTSHGWIMLLKAKSDAQKAIRQFNAMVKNQYGTSVKAFMSDFGGEFKSQEVLDLLRDLGIEIRTSVPHMHQQNGCAEHFNRTIIEKAQAIRFDACLPQSWWEFAVLHALHLYNRTPVRRVGWKTPYEMLKRKKPDVSHF